MHHGNITTHTKTGDGVRRCPVDAINIPALDISGGGSVLFASSTQLVGTEWQRFPDGMGYRLREGDEIAAYMHYLNASTQPITHRIPPDTIETRTLNSEATSPASKLPRAGPDV